jgi:hypothetical protein
MVGMLSHHHDEYIVTLFLKLCGTMYIDKCNKNKNIDYKITLFNYKLNVYFVDRKIPIL